MHNGFEKANRIVDGLVRNIDRKRTPIERESDTEGLGITGAYRGPLFDDKYRIDRGSKWSYTPTKS